MLDIGVPRHDETGRFAGYIGSLIDIAEQQEIEGRNQDLAGRLIHVQEEERSRIARDLHDDVSQQLAAVAIRLSGLKSKVGKRGTEPEIDATIATLQESTSTLADSVRNLSHQLHPNVLEHVGLVATLRRHCADVEANHNLKVVFSAGDPLDPLSLRGGALSVQSGAGGAHQRRPPRAGVHDHVQLSLTKEGVELASRTTVSGSWSATAPEAAWVFAAWTNECGSAEVISGWIRSQDRGLLYSSGSRKP